MATHHPSGSAHRRSHDRSRRRSAPGPQGRRIGLLLGTATLGAVGFALLAPATATANSGSHEAIRNTAAILSDSAAAGQDPAGIARDAAAIQALNDPTREKSSDRALGASAVVQAQARAQALAAAAAQRAADAADAAVRATADRQAADRGSAGPDAYRAYAREKVGATQFACLDRLWSRESGWRPTAQNPRSTAYGIAQLLDSTWSVTGVAKTGNGFRQVDAGLAYLGAAYPSGPCSAWAHETAAGWY